MTSSGRLTELKANIYAQEESVAENMNAFFEGKTKYIIFLSFCDGSSRAHVCKGLGNTIASSWKNAHDLMQKKVKALHLVPLWIKADIVTEIKEYSFLAFLDYVSQIKTNYFREGIAFDKLFNIALLEQEVNANAMIFGAKGTYQKQIVWKNLNFYLKNNLGLKYDVREDAIQKIYLFKTAGFFHDGSECHPLNNGWLDNGRRHVEKLEPGIVGAIINKSAHYLSYQVDKTGKFRYGYFPCFDKEIATYNILRHASTTYSMLEAYEIDQDPCVERAARLALDYLISEGIEFVEDAAGQARAFIVERAAGNEIKLGANAAALLALCKYTTVFDDYRYLPLMEKLAEGLAYFQNRQDGSFVHVLNFPDLSLKEQHRIVYYDGEAAFALLRLYGITSDERWLEMVELAFANFIRKGYWQHHDHWLSYCSCELVKYKPDKKYIDFNLQNASGILDFCLSRETTYPTLLELLMATYNMIEQLANDNDGQAALEDFDYGKLVKAIHHRARHQLNGYFFPEVAMYYKAPQNILGSFFIRHHSFRVRIDDIEHNLSGYCSYYRQMLAATTGPHQYGAEGV